MNIEQPATPATSSRASTGVRDSTEPHVLMMTPSGSSVQVVDATLPQSLPPKTPAHQQPLQQIITIRCGEDLRDWRTVHEQVLCHHSKKMMAFAVDAEAQREALRHCEEILEQLECITLSKTTPEYFVKLNIGAKLFPLIEDLYKHYPLEDYELEIRKIIKTQLRDQYTDNNLAERPKTLKEFQELSLSQRLALLNAEGAIELAEELCAQLQRYRALERLKANKNVVKAWAKGELRVRNAHEKSVTSLIEWAYYETTLHFEDAEHLYDIWALAKRLGFDQLAQECMNRLVDTTSDSLKHAFSNNIPLSYLIGYGSGNGSPGLPDLTDDFVATVFRHVLRDENPPARLSDLVIRTLGEGMDTKLWAQLQCMVGKDTAHRLIEIMLASKTVKPERAFEEASSIKCEEVYTSPTG